MNTRAFTFAEVLASLAFLAILLPVAIGALTAANRTGVVAERIALATQLGENKLGEWMLGDAWTTAESRGDFGADWPGYRWELNRGSWDVDTMTELNLAVYFQVQ